MEKGDKEQGFTIIEVALVLAIAGLIFLMVFIALPAVQRNAADARRRDDIATLISAIKKYQTNNRGALPTDFSVDADRKWGDLTGYLSDNFADPDGNEYRLINQPCERSGESISTGGACNANVLQNLENAVFPNNHELYIIAGATCDGSTVIKSANKRKMAVAYKLQGVGAFCNNT